MATPGAGLCDVRHRSTHNNSAIVLLRRQPEVSTPGAPLPVRDSSAAGTRRPDEQHQDHERREHHHAQLALKDGDDHLALL